MTNIDMVTHLTRQAAVSRATFGPGPRTSGVIEHIKKEFKEIEKAETPADKAAEWTDVAILGLDGLLRACREGLEESTPHGLVTHDMVAEAAVSLIALKQAKNEMRNWPDWRTMSADKPIEHERGHND